MWPNLQETADLVTFTEETLNKKLHFLCSVPYLIIYRGITFIAKDNNRNLSKSDYFIYQNFWFFSTKEMFQSYHNTELSFYRSTYVVIWRLTLYDISK